MMRPGVKSMSCGFVLLLAALSVAAGRDDRLLEAVKQRDVEAVRAVLAAGVEVDAVQPDGATALHWAAHLDQLEMAALLLEAGANVNAANDFGVTPLSLACTNGNAALVELLLRAGADPNLALLTGETPLMTAARTGSVDAVQALIARGAAVNASEPSQRQSALMWAVSERHAAVARLLVANGADVHARSAGGFSPLLFAAREGDLDSARALIEAGADPNDTSADHLSALLVATLRGHTELALLLLKHGADPNANGAGFAPLHWVAGSWETELTGPRGIVIDRDEEWRALRGVPSGKLELAQALLGHGADPNLQLAKAPPRVGFSTFRTARLTGATPYWLATMTADVEMMRVLAAAGADTRLPVEDNTSPLMAAAGVGRNLAESLVTNDRAFEAVMAAWELGADVNSVNDAGDTALHGAAQVRADAIVQFLVEKGAAVNVTNKRGDTPLVLAERYIQPGSAPVFVRTSTGDLLRKLGAQ